MILVENLVKEYSGFRAVKGINLHVEPGEIYGFLGPNGAGKTTTIRMLIGLLHPTSGRIVIDGHDLKKDPIKAKQVVGFVPDRPYIYQKLTANEFLRFIAGIYKVDEDVAERRIPELLEFFELSEWADELIESYSHGMKQRVVMSAALLHKPKVIIVDEPMVGLDPKGARLLKETFRRLGDEGVTIFMSTHTLEVAEELCGRISIIRKGEIVAEGTMDELRKAAHSGKEEHLESIFLSLTGGDDMQQVIKVLKM